MMVTEPRQYHAVINLTASLAIATNFILPGEEAIPNRLVVCEQDGLNEIRNPKISRLRRQQRKRRCPSRAADEERRHGPLAFDATIPGNQVPQPQTPRPGAIEPDTYYFSPQDTITVVTEVDEEFSRPLRADLQHTIQARDRPSRQFRRRRRYDNTIKLHKLPPSPAQRQPTKHIPLDCDAQQLQLDQLALRTRDRTTILRFMSIACQWRAISSSVTEEINSVTTEKNKVIRASGWLMLSIRFED